jgi:hypothetical protein
VADTGALSSTTEGDGGTGGRKESHGRLEADRPGGEVDLEHERVEDLAPEDDIDPLAGRLRQRHQIGAVERDASQLDRAEGEGHAGMNRNLGASGRPARGVGARDGKADPQGEIPVDDRSPGPRVQGHPDRLAVQSTGEDDALPRRGGERQDEVGDRRHRGGWGTSTKLGHFGRRCHEQQLEHRPKLSAPRYLGMTAATTRDPTNR